ncbi:MAG: thioredoxin family protein [Sulfurimonas sp.]|nr:thioredoxin family protein [Sulfurimonas sp.]
MKYIFVVFLLATTLFSSNSWQTNYHTALKIAQDKNKRVYMLIVSDDCRWCKKFERTTLKDRKTLERLNEKYILLHVIRDKNYIPSRFKTAPIPRHYFLTSKGKELFSVVGYRDVKIFNSFLDNVDERYERIAK